MTERNESSFISEWMLCEACHYSWLHDPTRAIPARCPECQTPWPTVIECPLSKTGDEVITTWIGQTKSGIILIFNEQGEWGKTIRLTWHEAAGLKHAINEACDHPLFKERDPKSKKTEIRYPE